MTITGLGFITYDVYSVEFGDGSPGDWLGADNVTIVDDETITCDVPAHASGAVLIRLQSFTMGGPWEYPGWFAYTDVPAPVLSSANYTVFDSVGLDHITLTGTDLDLADVYFDLGGPNETICAVGANTSTSVTFTTPSILPGVYDVVVVTSGGTSNALSIEAYAIPSATGSWDAPYAGSPWVGTGTVGGNLAEATSPPATGAAVNGYVPVDLNGTSNQLTTTLPWSSYVSTSAGTAIVFANVDSVAANAAAGAPYNNEGVLRSGGNGFVIMGVSSDGLRCAVNDGAYKQTTPDSVPFTPGDWHLFLLRWGGGTMDQGVDAGTPLSVASTGPSNLTGVIGVGRSIAGSGTGSLDGKILNLKVFASKLSDSDVTKIYAVLRCRYAL